MTRNSTVSGSAHSALTDGEPDPRAHGESNAFGLPEDALCSTCHHRQRNHVFGVCLGGVACRCEFFVDPGPPVIACPDCGAEDGNHTEECMTGKVE